jgi:hypothetical protein
LSEPRAGKVGYGIGKSGMVENIEDIQADLQRETAKERKLAAQSRIELGERVAGDGIATERARRAVWRGSEDSGIQPVPARNIGIGNPDRNAGDEIGPAKVVEALAEWLLVGLYVDGKAAARAEDGAERPPGQL